MTTRDAISDLPSTNKGQKVLAKEPLSWLQRVIRWCPKKQSFLTQISHHEEWVIKSEIGKPIFQFKISPLDGTFLKVNSNCTFFNPNCVPFQAICMVRTVNKTNASSFCQDKIFFVPDKRNCLKLKKYIFACEMDGK